MVWKLFCRQTDANDNDNNDSSITWQQNVCSHIKMWVITLLNIVLEHVYKQTQSNSKFEISLNLIKSKLLINIDLDDNFLWLNFNPENLISICLSSPDILKLFSAYWTSESWSGDHRYTHIPNFEWDNERNETCCDLSYNLFISWPSKIYKFL